jgi:predicted transposase/invertase (TIGR01784 family)
VTDLPKITSVYFDPTTDFGFKKLFGEEANKDLLLDFLNSILPQEHQIRTLTFQKTEQLPEYEEERKSVFDILCKDIHGETFIVEMQRANMSHFMDRTIYYGTFPIQSQAKKGRWDFNLARVYLIAVLDFEYDKDRDYWKKRQLLRSFSLRDEKGVLMSDKLHFKFLQLPFFKKKRHQLGTRFDKWCYFLKNLEDFNSIPDILNEPLFMKAFDVAKVSKMDPDDYILYQISKSKKYDMEILEEEAEKRGMEKGFAKGMEKGMEKGIEKGIEKGEAEERERNIMRLYLKGLKPLQISELLDIPLDTINGIVLK